MSAKTEHIILAPGPLHLFWTAGVYYMWELSRKYKVVLIVDEAYRASQPFAKAAALAGEVEILYVPAGNAWIRHRFYAREFKNVIKRFSPKAIFHHDAVYVQMMYLYYLGRKSLPGIIRVSYVAGISTINWHETYSAVIDYEVELVGKRYNVPRGIAWTMVEFKGWISLLLNYFLLPAVFCGKVFVPLMNVTNGTVLKKYWNDQFDYYLLYSEIDSRALQKWCGSTDGFVEIAHPLETSGEEFNRLFYGVSEEHVVAVMPTYGFVNTYQKEHGLSDQQLVGYISSKWSEAIDILSNKFAGYEIVLKLHPAVEKDLLWQNIVSNIQNQCSYLRIIPAQQNGQELILRSKVVVSDFSSVLWWATFFPSKIAISLDIFGTKYTDEMKYRERVRYFNSTNSFSVADFSIVESDLLHIQTKPTLLSFLLGKLKTTKANSILQLEIEKT